MTTETEKDRCRFCQHPIFFDAFIQRWCHEFSSDADDCGVGAAPIQSQYWLPPQAVLADPCRCSHKVRSFSVFGGYRDVEKVVECDSEHDVIQCQLCGRTRAVRCDFEENYS